ncbi:hypothetical protein FGB62_603g01 [Gracilaria domingensis]|nr:hypothetical protein FGB62_603g01 [Gracilaria domingensis]
MEASAADSSLSVRGPWVAGEKCRNSPQVTDFSSVIPIPDGSKSIMLGHLMTRASRQALVEEVNEWLVRNGRRKKLSVIMTFYTTNLSNGKVEKTYKASVGDGDAVGRDGQPRCGLLLDIIHCDRTVLATRRSGHDVAVMHIALDCTIFPLGTQSVIELFRLRWRHANSGSGIIGAQSGSAGIRVMMVRKVDLIPGLDALRMQCICPCSTGTNERS